MPEALPSCACFARRSAGGSPDDAGKGMFDGEGGAGKGGEGGGAGGGRRPGAIHKSELSSLPDTTAQPQILALIISFVKGTRNIW
eukprot:scaffold164873_cov19-Tisochrysis_lutea.AAC.3